VRKGVREREGKGDEIESAWNGNGNGTGDLLDMIPRIGFDRTVGIIVFEIKDGHSGCGCGCSGGQVGGLGWAAS
jgi:hypothetical protein